MIAWHDDLSVGVPEIDEQHKELISRIGRLFAALDQNVARQELAEIFTFLESYVVVHFGTEERYMQASTLHEYLDENHHKSEHQAFVRDFREFRNDVSDPAASGMIVTEFKRWIVNWYMLHIEKVDKGLGAFLRDRSTSK